MPEFFTSSVLYGEQSLERACAEIAGLGLKAIDLWHVRGWCEHLAQGEMGVRRVLELEAEVDRLRAELDEARAEARAAVDRTHRQYRRELVPLSQMLVPFRPGGRASRAGGTTNGPGGRGGGVP